MTREKFKKFMCQGHGRCAIVLQSEGDIEKYKNIVLWGCRNDLSFDRQCEGTRAAYVYSLSSYFNDAKYFLFPTIAEFEKKQSYSSAKFNHLVDLLAKFAENGYSQAKIALEKKYDFLFDCLLKKRRFARYDYERDAFEAICITLYSLGGADSLLKIVSDLGRLLRENSHYTIDEFDWLLVVIEGGEGKKRLSSLLGKKAKNDVNIACFYQCYLNHKNVKYYANQVASDEIPSADDLKKGIYDNSSRYIDRVIFMRHASESEKNRLAQMIIDEPDSDIKAKMLSMLAFGDAICLLPHGKIIEYSRSANFSLRDAALSVLAKCRSQEVREYALELLENDEHRASVIKILIANYTTSIKDLLLTELEKIKIDYSDECAWHEIGCEILGAHEYGVSLPKEFFLYIYNNTLCSYCRERALKALARRRALTSDIIEECRYDCNADIASYVSKRQK